MTAGTTVDPMDYDVILDVLFKLELDTECIPSASHGALIASVAKFQNEARPFASQTHIRRVLPPFFHTSASAEVASMAVFWKDIARGVAPLAEPVHHDDSPEHIAFRSSNLGIVIGLGNHRAPRIDVPEHLGFCLAEKGGLGIVSSSVGVTCADLLFERGLDLFGRGVQRAA